MSEHSKVTALVPAYQAGEFIQLTLDSLSAQTHGDFNVIVSIDLCTDDTHAICLNHGVKDPRFRVIRQDQRLGYVGNCNFLLGKARSELALFAFHDDLLAPTYLEKLCAVLDARPDVVLSYSDVLLTPVVGPQQLWVYTQLDGLRQRTQRGLKVLSRAGQWWVPNRGVFRLGQARKIQGLKTHGAGEFSADWPWLFHMSLLGEFARVPETLCHKFYKPSSLSRSWTFTHQQHFEAVASCMRELWNADLSAEEKLRLAVPLTSWMIKARAQIRAGSAQNDPHVPDR